MLKAPLRHWNIHDTAHLHTLLPLYVGQQVRLTEKVSANHRLVQEAEGTVVQIVLDPLESSLARSNRPGHTLAAKNLVGPESLTIYLQGGCAR